MRHRRDGLRTHRLGASCSPSPSTRPGGGSPSGCDCGCSPSPGSWPAPADAPLHLPATRPGRARLDGLTATRAPDPADARPPAPTTQPTPARGTRRPPSELGPTVIPIGQNRTQIPAHRCRSPRTRDERSGLALGYSSCRRHWASKLSSSIYDKDSFLFWTLGLPHVNVSHANPGSAAQRLLMIAIVAWRQFIDHLLAPVWPRYQGAKHLPEAPRSLARERPRSRAFRRLDRRVARDGQVCPRPHISNSIPRAVGVTATPGGND